jgi:hypothetical protein
MKNNLDMEGKEMKLNHPKIQTDSLHIHSEGYYLKTNTQKITSIGEDVEIVH